MRTRSPRIAPPVNGEVGSMASTATSSPFARNARTSPPVSVDFPAPGAPVSPTVYASPPRGNVSLPTDRADAPPRSTNDSSCASAAREPLRASSSSSAAGRSARGKTPNLQGQGCALELVVRLIDDLGHALDTVLENPFDSRLQGDRRRRTAHARSDELDSDDATRLVDVVQADVTAVGLDGRTDRLDRLLDLLAHQQILASVGGRIETEQSGLRPCSRHLLLRCSASCCDSRPRSWPTASAGRTGCRSRSGWSPTASGSQS